MFKCASAVVFVWCGGLLVGACALDGESAKPTTSEASISPEEQNALPVDGGATDPDAFGDSGAPLANEGRTPPCPDNDCQCYSPARNLDGSFDKGRRGCNCGSHDLDVCVDGTTLVCRKGRWEAAEDGACFRVDPCASIVETLDACVRDHDSCAKRSDGKFCARDRRGDE
jgi:hypothetical protein